MTLTEQVEKIAQEQASEEAEAFLDVSDVPEDDEDTSSTPEKESLLLPETHLMLFDGKSSSFGQENETAIKAEEKKTLVLGRVADQLLENEKKALQQLKHLVQEALHKQEFGGNSFPPLLTIAEQEKKKAGEETVKMEVQEAETFGALPEEDGAKTLEAIEETIVARYHPAAEKTHEEEEVYIWGVKLLEDERSDLILLKFLRARDFKVKDAFDMMKNTMIWRREFGIDALVEEEDLGNELERVVFMHGHSRQGHPVCYNVYGDFQDKELYRKMFSDEEKRRKFLRWRIEFLEKSIRKMDFTTDALSTIVQVNDLKNSPGPNRWELTQATNQALHVLQDNYPEFVAKQVFINVPWWYLVLHKMISPFLTERTKSKFVVAGPSSSTETLLKYISGDQIPIEYGGMSKDGELETANSVTEIILRPSTKHIVEFPVAEACVVMWELRVVGWEVSFGAEFVPTAEDGYTVIIQKTRKFVSSEVQYISDSYRVCEPGKLLLTLHNLSPKKKTLLYRFKTKLSG